MFSPVVRLLTVSTNAILRVCAIDPDQNDEDVSEENIGIMADVGTIDNDGKKFIHNVYEFDDLTTMFPSFPMRKREKRRKTPAAITTPKR